MEQRGIFEPEDEADVEEQWTALGSAAQTVTREIARAMEFDRDEYRSRVDSAVVRTARDALYASLLRVTVGSMEEFEQVIENYEYPVHREGSPNVDNVVWHVSPARKQIVAATFQSEPDAAVATLRRQAYGRLYREILDPEDYS